MPPGIARFARSGWSRAGVSWSATDAGTTCPAQITINREVVRLEKTAARESESTARNDCATSRLQKERYTQVSLDFPEQACVRGT